MPSAHAKEGEWKQQPVGNDLKDLPLRIKLLPLEDQKYATIAYDSIVENVRATKEFENEFTVYMNENGFKYSTKESPYSYFKVEGVLDFPIEKVVKFLSTPEKRIQYDQNYERYELIRCYGVDTNIYYGALKNTVMLSSRDCLVAKMTLKEPNGTVHLSEVSCDHQKMPP